MKTLFFTVSSIAAASLLSAAAIAAPAGTKAQPAAEAAAQTPSPEIVEDAPMTAAQPAEAAAPAPATDAAATPSAPAETAAAPAQPTDPATILKNEFPTFDADKSGELSAVEFTTWMEALRKNAPGQPMTADQQTAWIKQSFAQADTSKNGTLNLDELTKFLVKG